MALSFLGTFKLCFKFHEVIQHILGLFTPLYIQCLHLRFSAIFSTLHSGLLFVTGPSQALRIVIIHVSAGSSSNTSSGSRPSSATALSPFRDVAAVASSRRGRRRGARSCASGLSSTAEEVNNGSVRRLCGEVVIPEASITLTGEGAGDPGVLVCEIPDSDTDAVICGEACSDGVHVVSSLLLVTRSGGREGGEADVNLGVGYLDSECGEGLEIGNLRVEIWGLADDEMSLETNSINLDVASLKRLDNIQGGCGFGTRVLDVVIVVVQLDIRIVLSSCLECNGDVLRANLDIISLLSLEVRELEPYSVVKNVGSPSAIVIEGFVYYVPAVALTLIVGNLALNMSLKSRNQGCVCPRAGGNYSSLLAFCLAIQNKICIPQPGNSLYQTRLWHLNS